MLNNLFHWIKISGRSLKTHNSEQHFDEYYDRIPLIEKRFSTISGLVLTVFGIVWMILIVLHFDKILSIFRNAVNIEGILGVGYIAALLAVILIGPGLFLLGISFIVRASIGNKK